MEHSKTILIIAAFVCMQGLTQAQDTRYTQSYTAPLRLNPALMGPNTNIKGILSYRGQWNAIDKGYTTYRFTFLYPLILDEQGKLDIGLSAVSDKAGAFNTLDIALAISYSLELTENHNLSAALTGGFVQKSLDAGSLTFDEQYVLGSYNGDNPTNETIVNEKVTYPDYGVGLLYFFNPEEGKLNIYAGMSVFHHNKPNESFKAEEDDLAMRFSYHGGVKIMTDGKFQFTPNIHVTKQDGAEEIALGLYTDYVFNEKMRLILGTWYRYRNQNAFALMLGYEHKSFGLAYSYDIAPFGMSKVISGAMTHEITLNFKIDRAKKDVKRPLLGML